MARSFSYFAGLSSFPNGMAAAGSKSTLWIISLLNPRMFSLAVAPFGMAIYRLLEGKLGAPAFAGR